MSSKYRGLQAPTFEVLFRCRLIDKLINFVMKGGKKQKAVGIVNRALREFFKMIKCEEKDRASAIKRLETNMLVEVNFFKRRVGSRNYKIPYMMSSERAYRLSLKAFYKCFLSSKERGWEGLAKELHSTYLGSGKTISNKLNKYQEASANRMSLHLIYKFNLKDPNALKLNLTPKIIRG